MQKSAVITDKKKILENANTITWREARRMKGPIYDVLVQELYEANCHVAAKHMQCLARKENTLIENSTIRIALKHKPALLESLFENVKTAETASRLKQCGGLAVTFQLLHQCLQLLEHEGHTFDWLLEDLYKIVAHISDSIPEDKLSDGSMRAIAHIYYNYGMFLCSRNLEMEKAVVNLEKALELARSNNWTASGRDCEEWDKCETLHGVVVTKLVKMLLDYAMKVVHSDEAKAMELTREAITTIAEIKTDESMLIRCQAHIVEAKIFIQNEDYKRALCVLDHLSIDITSPINWQYAQLYCELILYKGVCYDGLGDHKCAQVTLRKGLVLSEKYKFLVVKAKCCFSLGRLHSQQQHELVTAKRYLEEAKKIYESLGQLNELKKVIYQLAKLESKRLFPLFMDLMKSHEERYCCYFHLRNWKNQCKPFWPEMNQQLFEKQVVEAHCLLDADSAACVNPVRSMPTLLPSGAAKNALNTKLKLVASQFAALEDIRHSAQLEGNTLYEV